VEGYREHGNIKQRIIKLIGFTDEFTYLYDDPAAHSTLVAEEKAKEKQERAKAATIGLLPGTLLPFDTGTLSCGCTNNIGGTNASWLAWRADRFQCRNRARVGISEGLSESNR
jgi:hypothetical protein